MSQTRVLTVVSDNVTRVRLSDGLDPEGCGGNHALLAGDSTVQNRKYTSLLKFGMDWSDVGRIVSATLVVYTKATNADPKVGIRRLGTAFADGNNTDNDFDATDYTNPTQHTSDAKTVGGLAQTLNAVNRIDVTRFLNAWAPTTVKQSTGKAGGGTTNNGLAITPYAGGSHLWQGWSNHHTDILLRPTIELVYELGITIPDAPSNLTPTGSVTSLDAFQGDFTDDRAADELRAAEVEVYSATPSSHISYTKPPFLSEREGAHLQFDGQPDDAVDEDCVGVSLIMLANASVPGVAPNTLEEAERLRDAAGYGPTGGTTVENYVTAMTARYGLTMSPVLSSASAATLLAALTVGKGASVMVRPANLPAGHRLRRFHGTFAGLHQVTVLNVGVSKLWYMDPEGPSTGYLGEFVTNAEITTLFEGSAGFLPIDTTTSFDLPLYTERQEASASEIAADRFNLIPSGFVPVTGVTYRWRARVTDNQGKTSAWTDPLTSFSVSNTAPEPPVITPADAVYASLNGVLFRGGTFVDADGDTLGSFQLQLADLAEGDLLWDEPAALKWNSGRRYAPTGATSWVSLYGGPSLMAGVYTLRARQWDSRAAVSDWAYTTITLTEDFTVAPGQQTSIQQDPRAPWRIIIYGMASTRGPETIKAVLENAKSTGASELYNAAGEMHFTLPVDHPQLHVIEPKQTHYEVQFYTGDGWRGAYFGLMWDMRPNDTSVIFFGIDYLALYNTHYDERFDPDDPDLPASSGGSKYIAETTSDIITDALTVAKERENSPVGFINIGSIADMPETVTIWSTLRPTLDFVVGLIDAHRNGTGKNTRISVNKLTDGTFEVSVVDDPGSTRNNLKLRYGELVQGYEFQPFGTGWGSVVHSIGRTREGLKLLYNTQPAPGIDPVVWGRFAVIQLFENVSDENDLLRRTMQAALVAGRIGNGAAIGLRSGWLKPFDGYDICDHIPIEVIHGAVDTRKYGSGYWTVFGIVWEANDDGSQATNPIFRPRIDTTEPSDQLLPQPTVLSPQPEWQ